MQPRFAVAAIGALALACVGMPSAAHARINCDRFGCIGTVAALHPAHRIRAPRRDRPLWLPMGGTVRMASAAPREMTRIKAAQKANAGPAVASHALKGKRRGKHRATPPRAISRACVAFPDDRFPGVQCGPGIGFSGGDLVAIARRHIGATAAQLGLPRRLWCADFLNRIVLPAAGLRGTGSRQARSFAGYGRRLPGPQVGAIAVLSRGRGGHAGIVSGIDPDGDPIIISGNHNGRVGEGVYPRSRVIAYVSAP